VGLCLTLLRNSDIDTKFRPGPDPPFSPENDDLITDEAFMVCLLFAFLKAVMNKKI
jgi:hypothetical protein